MKLDDLASQLGFKSADDLFEVVGKDELSLRTIENMLRPPEPSPTQDDYVLAKKPRPASQNAKGGGVLVVGMGSLLTQLAKCCKWDMRHLLHTLDKSLFHPHDLHVPTRLWSHHFLYRYR